ncbi:MAG: hypothetical protein MJZ68_09290, partial [archaeon]|nr:hypothetical protein [archaeon]
LIWCHHVTRGFESLPPRHFFTGSIFCENLRKSLLQIIVKNHNQNDYFLIRTFSELGLRPGRIHLHHFTSFTFFIYAIIKNNLQYTYIPYQKEDRERISGFFPGRDEPFDLELPHGNTISAKICQDEGKAIMSNPNKDLGNWLLRDVLGLEKGQLVTMDLLEGKEVNAVLFTK